MHALDELLGRVRSRSVATIDKQQQSLEGSALIARLVIRSAACSSSTQELGQHEHLVAEVAASSRGSLRGGLGSELHTQVVHLLLVRCLDTLELGAHAIVEAVFELAQQRELLLELDKLGLQSGLLQSLSLLVGIDLALVDEIVQGERRVLGDDGIDFCGAGLRAVC